MQIDRRITNGLAWAGVLLVVGVPAADILSAQFFDRAEQAPAGQIAVVTPAVTAPAPAPLSQRPVAPAKVEVAATKPAPAAAKPAAPAPTQTASVVDDFLESGKPLPSYITGAPNTVTQPAPAQPAATPAPAQTAAAQPTRVPIMTMPAPVAADPVQVASIPAKVAPMPMPLSMRPASRNMPLTAAAPVTDIILPPEIVQPRQPVTVNSADLEDWETGPLSDFLARQQQGGSSATVTSDYDPNGFFLDQGPNPRQRDRVIGWEEQPVFSFFP